MRPPEGNIEVELGEVQRVEVVMVEDLNRRGRHGIGKILKTIARQIMADIRTMYNREAKKKLPANVPVPEGAAPGGGLLSNSGDSEPGKELGIHAGKTVPRGSRLTPERLAKMNIGGNFLTPAEKQVFIDILYEFEGALAFDDTEMGLLDPRIEPPVEVSTVPHSPWQQNNLQLPKSMQDEAARMI